MDKQNVSVVDDFVHRGANRRTTYDECLRTASWSSRFRIRRLVRLRRFACPNILSVISFLPVWNNPVQTFRPIFCSLRSKRLSNIERAVLGNVGGARSTRERKEARPARPARALNYTRACYAG